MVLVSTIRTRPATGPIKEDGVRFVKAQTPRGARIGVVRADDMVALSAGNLFDVSDIVDLNRPGKHIDHSNTNREHFGTE